jgi:ketosteroid isomerase-like protein
MSDGNVALLRRSYEAFNRGDVAAVVEALDPGMEWDEPDLPGVSFSGEHRGREQLRRKVLEPVRDEIEGFQVEPEEFIDAGAQVVVLGRYRGHGRDTGIGLDAPFAHVWTMRGGKPVRYRDYYDTANWLRSLSGIAM